MASPVGASRGTDAQDANASGATAAAANRIRRQDRSMLTWRRRLESELLKVRPFGLG